VTPSSLQGRPRERGPRCLLAAIAIATVALLALLWAFSDDGDGAASGRGVKPGFELEEAGVRQLEQLLANPPDNPDDPNRFLGKYRLVSLQPTSWRVLLPDEGRPLPSAAVGEWIEIDPAGQEYDVTITEHALQFWKKDAAGSPTLREWNEASERFRIPSWSHLRPLLNPEILERALALPPVSLNRRDRI